MAVPTNDGGKYAQPSPLLIRMPPNIRRDLPHLRQLDHVNRRRVSPRPAGPAFQGGFQLPDRRIPRPADGIERQARTGLAGRCVSPKRALLMLAKVAELSGPREAWGL
jgi:hypothetical protein